MTHESGGREMTEQHPVETPLASRREFLSRHVLGIGSVALATMLKQENLLATPANVPRGQTTYDLRPKQTHFAP